MNIAEWIMFIISLITKALEIVTAVEAQVGAGNGAVKKEIAINQVRAIAQAADATPQQIDKTVSVMSPLFDVHVSALNAAGVFKRTPINL